MTTSTGPASGSAASGSAAPASPKLPALLPPGSSGAGWGGRFAAPVTFAVFGLADIALFGIHARGTATFAFNQEFAKATVPNLALPAAATCYACGALTLVLAALRLLIVLGWPATVATAVGRRGWRRLLLGLVLFCFVVALLAWSDGGQAIAFNVVDLLSGTFSDSIPLMLGALTGVICSRTGVINIAIEGQLLLGAFCAAIATSVTGSLWLGLVCGALAGSLVATLLAVFAIAYAVDQIVLGVVLNTLVLGLTGYLYNAIMIPFGNTLNNPATFTPVKIPLLGDIPIIGPVFFDATVFLYITYVALAGVHIGLFRTRWGLRTRAVGEHPVAADTVGIGVLAMRYRNVIASGLIAGIGGAYFTIGSVGSFGINMSSGEGYIALAAMIFGRYTPVGAVLAALLFGFTTQLQSILSSINVPIQSNLLLLAPYVVTIVVVAGLVGKVRGPRAEGVPYVKS
ncbi:MAG: ABC transporter permease [Nocardiopsaceae bacterium]|nr:ABC transporter permease [Nocardiopsaceae bacterium]